MNQKQAGKAYSEVKKFNEIAGQLDVVTEESIALQLDLIQEEYLETVEAFDGKNNVELLDGAIDMFVVVSGLLQKLEASGYNVAEAMKRVTDNNLSKFPAWQDMKGIPLPSDFSGANGWTHYLNEEYLVWVIRDGNGKIRKPEGFQSVELHGLTPQTWEWFPLENK